MTFVTKRFFAQVTNSRGRSDRPLSRIFRSSQVRVTPELFESAIVEAASGGRNSQGFLTRIVEKAVRCQSFAFKTGSVICQ